MNMFYLVTFALRFNSIKINLFSRGLFFYSKSNKYIIYIPIDNIISSKRWFT